MNLKKLVAAGAAALMCTSLAFSFSSAKEVSAAQQNNFLVFGDSIANGNNGTTLEFPLIAHDAVNFGNNNIEYANLAQNGLTSSEILEVIKNGYTSESAPDLSKKLLADADTIIISAGANDYLRELMKVFSEYLDEGDDISTMSKEKLEVIKNRIKADQLNAASKISQIRAVTDSAYKEVKNIVTELHNANPDADIYLLDLYNPFETASEYDQNIGTMMNSMAYAIIDTYNAKLSMIDNATLVPVADAFKGHTKDYLGLDARDVHPNNAGQVKIASLLTSVINQEEEKIAMGKVLGTLTDEQIADLPAIITDGIEIIRPEAEPEVTVTTASVTTADVSETTDPETTSAVSESETVSSSDTAATAVTTTAAVTTTTTTAANTTTSQGTTTVKKESASPSTSDRGISAVAITGLFAAVCTVFSRRKNK